MIDFTSALYLGQQPLSVPFPRHLSVTTGKPAALFEPLLQQRVAQTVARRQGLDSGLLAPSTLHLVWDVFATLGRSGAVLIDEATYAVGRWGAMQALLRGVPVTTFPASDGDRLARLLYAHRQQHRTPWLVTDGWNVAQGQPAPLAMYLNLLRSCRDGLLLVDDTQAFGVLGGQPTPERPYGTGGGGCLPFTGLQSPDVVTITSLAKGLGVPVAVLAGNAARIGRFRRDSEVRVHTSPVSNLHAWAAWQALETDRLHGDRLRQRLYEHVRLFQETLHPITTTGGWFPVQKLRLPTATAVLALYHRLKQRGILALLLANGEQPTVPDLAFCIRADHRPTELVQTSRLIRSVISENDLSYPQTRNAFHHEFFANS